jgi:glc operon protein GlcG
MADLVVASSLSLDAARRVVAAAEAKAVEMGFAVCVCVSDTCGEPIVRVRMDGAPRLSAGISENKAWTVTQFNGMPTHAWWPVIKDDPMLVQGLTLTPRFIVFGGGVGVFVDGALVGAVGVSGGTADQDQAVAEAGAASVW